MPKCTRSALIMSHVLASSQNLGKFISVAATPPPEHGKSRPAAGSVEASRLGHDVDAEIQRWGNRIFDLMEAAEPPSFFSRKGFYSSLMEWAMRDEHFKTQLFRFVDVLPTLESSAEVARHLKEYLGDESVRLSGSMKLG